jgi:filamentous hemagglutinin family protein
MPRTRFFCRNVFGAGALVLCACAQAEITIDGTLGRARSLEGPDYVIPAGLGQTRGANLFHSFGQFNLTSGESATFTGPSRIRNIIGRVTGGEASSIDGLVRSSISGANLYLLNPSGILFGPNASLDVSGSFYASSADYLRLADGGRFDARNPSASRLTVAPPAAFGFLGAPAPITVAGSLSVPVGKTLGLIGGDIAIGEYAGLVAAGGRIDLVALRSPGELALSSSVPDVATFATLGDIVLAKGAVASTAGDTGGRIYLRGGRLTMESASLDSSNLGDLDHPGVGIDIAVRGEFLLAVAADAPDASVDSSSYGAGRAGDIRIKAGSIRMTGGPAKVFTSPYVQIVSDNYGSGRGGDITVNAGELDMDNKSGIATFSSGLGGSGNVSINVNAMRMGDGGFVGSAGVDGDANGNIHISADYLSISGQQSGIGSSVNINNTGASGDVGNVNIVVGRLVMHQGAAIASATSGLNSKNPDLRAGNIQIMADTVELDSGARIEISSTGFVTGDISINARTLRLTGGGYKGFPGDHRNGNAGIYAQAGARGGTSPDIRLTTGDVQILNGASVSSSTVGIASGGAIQINADQVLVSGYDPQSGQASSIESISGLPGNNRESFATAGAGGDIDIRARGVVVRDQAVISVASLTTGDSGNVRIEADTITLSGNAAISASAESSGNAGDIDIIARDSLRLANSAIRTQARQSSGGNINIAARSLVYLKNSAITASVLGGLGNGGNIAIDPDFVVLQNSLIEANAFGGNGGNVSIVARNFLATPDSSVSASSTLGLQGNVVISAPAQDINRDMNPLPEAPADPAASFKTPCAAAGTRFSSFAVARPPVNSAGKGSMPSVYSSVGAHISERSAGATGVKTKAGIALAGMAAPACPN